MKTFRTIALLLLVALRAVGAFAPISSPTRSNMLIPSESFAVETSEHASIHKVSTILRSTVSNGDVAQTKSTRYNGDEIKAMGKVGIFTPPVYVSKVVLGNRRFIVWRSRLIEYHWTGIRKFCKWAGMDRKTTVGMLKMCRANGDTLGLLW